MKKERMILKGRAPIGFNRPTKKSGSVHFLMATFGNRLLSATLYSESLVCK